MERERLVIAAELAVSTIGRSRQKIRLPAAIYFDEFKATRGQ
jgi:hypothetical protein